MILGNNTKRCGLFIYFDKHGLVDDYVLVMLEHMKKHMDYLIIICNGFVENTTIDKLSKVSDEIIGRANVGFDSGAYREALFYLGWKELGKYDEIIMFNYTMMGPIDSFDDMFETMSQKDIDFWGITKYHKYDEVKINEIKYGYIPEHIQSHFIAVRSDMFKSYQFRDFMMNRKNPKSYTDAVYDYEAIFTKTFNDLGFKSAVYADSSELEGNSFYPIMFKPTYMVKEKKCPIVKRRTFFMDYNDCLDFTAGEPTPILLDYFSENEKTLTTDMIFDNILRQENLSEIHRRCHFNYVINSKFDDGIFNLKTALFILVNNSKSILFYKKYLNSININLYDVYFVLEEKDEEIIKKSFDCDKCIFIRVTASDYYNKLICVQNIIKNNSYSLVSFLEMIEIPKNNHALEVIDSITSKWESVLYNEHAVINIINVFKENNKLGLLIPPEDKHGSYYSENEKQWRGEFDESKNLISKLTPSINIKKEENPLAPQYFCFWCRAEFVCDWIDFIKNSTKKIALISLSHFIQDKRYYTGVIYIDDLFPTEFTNSFYMLRENNKVVFEKLGLNTSSGIRRSMEFYVNKFIKS